MPSSKGSFFVAMKKFVIERFGPDHWARVMGILSSEDRATVVDSAVADDLWCIQFQAYMGRVFELVGAREVKMAHVQCCARGDSICVFEGSWR